MQTGNWIFIMTLLLLLLLLLLSTFIERTFAGCHKCAEDNSYALNNNVFSLFLNVVRVMSGDLSSSGRLFHTRGPRTAKPRSP